MKNKQRISLRWWILMLIIIGCLYLIFWYTKVLHISFQYYQWVKRDERVINTYDSKSQWLIGNIVSDDEQVRRLEFDQEQIKNKNLSLNIQGTGKVEGYFVTDSIQLNPKSWVWTENIDGIQYYKQLGMVRFFTSLFSKDRTERKIITNLDSINIFHDITMMQVLRSSNSSLFEKIFECVFSSFIFNYNLYGNNYEWNDGLWDSRRYSFIPLRDGEYHIVFKPFDLQYEKIKKIWYLLYLSWWTIVSYHFEENPLMKKDSDWLAIEEKNLRDNHMINDISINRIKRNLMKEISFNRKD